MIIKLSRHARRRAKLYKIPVSMIETIVAESVLSDGEHEIISNVAENNLMTAITTYPLKIGKTSMKVHYDEEVDALYLKFGDQEPDGVIEISEGINIDTTSDGKLTGIEILRASKKINIDTILSYTIELDKGLLKGNIA